MSSASQMSLRTKSGSPCSSVVAEVVKDGDVVLPHGSVPATGAGPVVHPVFDSVDAPAGLLTPTGEVEGFSLYVRVWLGIGALTHPPREFLHASQENVKYTYNFLRAGCVG